MIRTIRRIKAITLDTNRVAWGCRVTERARNAAEITGTKGAVNRSKRKATIMTVRATGKRIMSPVTRYFFMGVCVPVE
jgi:hypothetical protein